MGCMTSKMVMAKSGSYRYKDTQEVNALQLQHPTPLLQDLFTPNDAVAHHLLRVLSQVPPTSDDQELTANIVDSDFIANSREHHRRSKSSDLQLLSSPLKDENEDGQSRSFHTVEEYDALLGRICKAEPPATYNKPQEDGQMKDTNEGDMTKRQRVAKGLSGSLEMPPTNIEFQTVGSLKQWLLDLHVSSPGGATPKFGSYYTSSGKQGEEVDPELVSAFEEYMLQLQAEEDDIIKQIEATKETNITGLRV